MKPDLRWQRLVTRAARACAALVVSLLLAVLVLAAEEHPGQVPLLEVGKPTEQDLEGGESHAYRIEVPARTYLFIICEQKGIDLALSLIDPQGEELASEDGPGGAWVEEGLAIIVEEPGLYELQVSAPPDSGTGSYGLRLDEARAARSDDPLRVQAENLFNLALHLQAQETAESREKAIAFYKEGLPLWQELGDIRAQGIVLHQIGLGLSDLGRVKEALQYYELALPLRRQADVPAELATTLNNLAGVHQVLGDRLLALEVYEEALRIRREIGDESGEAKCLNNMGLLFERLGDPAKARECLDAALVLQKGLDDRRPQAATLTNIANLELKAGRHREALRLYWEVLVIQDQFRDLSAKAVTLHNMAFAHQYLGEWELSLRYYQQAIELERATGNKLAEAGTLGILGSLYLTLGEDDRGEELLREALEARQEAGDRPNAALVLCRLADLSIERGELKDARTMLVRAVRTGREASAPIPEARARMGLARLLAKEGVADQGISEAENALGLYQKAGDRQLESEALRELGVLFRSVGKVSEAENRYRESLALSRDLQDPYGQVLAHLGLADLFETAGKLKPAMASTDSALTTVETLRTGLASPDLRASFLATRHLAYERAVDLRMRLHAEDPEADHARSAFEVSERSRARSLLEVVGGSSYPREPSQGEHVGVVASGTPDDRAVKPLSLDALQRELLDEETLLLEYALGETRSYLFVVSSEALSTFVLPGRRAIEDRARRLRTLVTARNQRVPGESPEGRRSRIDSADDQYWAEATELARTLLKPAVSRFNNRRLVIVADGALHYLPFAALPDPAAAGEDSPPSPLVVKHEVVSLPSASVLAMMRRTRHERPSPERVLAIFADPVFSSEDPRLNLGRTGLVATPDPGTADAVATMSSLLGNGAEGFPRLRFSRREAAAIQRLLPSEDVFSAFDLSASREAVVESNLERFRVLHFATHGVVSSDRPELSSLVLSLVDQDGRLRDGFLRLPDVYDLQLNADLVVLSACRTALGKEIRGEGIVGLARGFLYAGADRVAATLWDVQDRASGELMRKFYEALLLESVPASEALRRAQADLWSQDRWSAPYYWAGFTLQGEWR